MVWCWQAGDSSPGPPLAESVAQTGSGPSNLQDYEPLLAEDRVSSTRGVDGPDREITTSGGGRVLRDERRNRT
jgi:hypothetical protein